MFLSTKIIPGSYSARASELELELARTHARVSPRKILLKYRIGLHLLHAYEYLHNFTFMRNAENASRRCSVGISVHARTHACAAALTCATCATRCDHNGVIYNHVSGIILAARVKYRLTRCDLSGGRNIEGGNAKGEKGEKEKQKGAGIRRPMGSTPGRARASEVATISPRKFSVVEALKAPGYLLALVRVASSKETRCCLVS